MAPSARESPRCAGSRPLRGRLGRQSPNTGAAGQRLGGRFRRGDRGAGGISWVPHHSRLVHSVRQRAPCAASIARKVGP